MAPVQHTESKHHQNWPTILHTIHVRQWLLFGIHTTSFAVVVVVECLFAYYCNAPSPNLHQKIPSNRRPQLVHLYMTMTTTKTTTFSSVIKPPAPCRQPLPKNPPPTRKDQSRAASAAKANIISCFCVRDGSVCFAFAKLLWYPTFTAESHRMPTTAWLTGYPYEKLITDMTSSYTKHT